MAKQLFIVPKVFLSTRDAFFPKYFGDGTIASSWGGRDFDDMFMVVSDPSEAERMLLTAQSDVFLFPIDLMQKVSPTDVTKLQAVLDPFNIPISWITTSRTYRDVVRVIAGVMSFNQRFKGENDNRTIFDGGVSKSRRFDSLPAQVRTRLKRSADSFSLDTSSVSGATTVQELLQAIGLQLVQLPVVISGMVI